MMKSNIRIAKELIRAAKKICAADAISKNEIGEISGTVSFEIKDLSQLFPGCSNKEFEEYMKQKNESKKQDENSRNASSENKKYVFGPPLKRTTTDPDYKGELYYVPWEGKPSLTDYKGRNVEVDFPDDGEFKQGDFSVSNVCEYIKSKKRSDNLPIYKLSSLLEMIDDNKVKFVPRSDHKSDYKYQFNFDFKTAQAILKKLSYSNYCDSLCQSNSDNFFGCDIYGVPAIKLDLITTSPKDYLNKIKTSHEYQLYTKLALELSSIRQTKAGALEQIFGVIVCSFHVANEDMQYSLDIRKDMNFFFKQLDEKYKKGIQKMNELKKEVEDKTAKNEDCSKEFNELKKLWNSITEYAGSYNMDDILNFKKFNVDEINNQTDEDIENEAFKFSYKQILLEEFEKYLKDKYGRELIGIDMNFSYGDQGFVNENGDVIMKKISSWF